MIRIDLTPIIGPSAGKVRPWDGGRLLSDAEAAFTAARLKAQTHRYSKVEMVEVDAPVVPAKTREQVSMRCLVRINETEGHSVGTSEYMEFLGNKRTTVKPSGFTPDIPDGGILFDWQRATVEWACKLGRCALFADTGLGKTAMQLTWAHEVVKHLVASGQPGRVLILAPLAVGPQTVREAVKFGIPDVRFVRSQDQVQGGISICNYESMHKLDGDQFGGIVLDESSILKSFMGKYRNDLIAKFSATPYKLACTATPAPNDFVELGNHSEFLGVMDRTNMLARWFINDLGNTVDTWRLKGHAIVPFWDWVTSWARCIGVPSDMGQYSDTGYDLPDLHIVRHTVSVDISDGAADGNLFRMVDASAINLHRERRRTAEFRARCVADLVAEEPDEAWLIWVETDYDSAALMPLLPSCAVEVSGKDSLDKREHGLLGFSDGDVKILVTKPKIAGFGLNWQHCARMAFVGPSYSYEQFYQSVRRCWRFGQTREVFAHMAMATTEQMVGVILDRKSGDHDEMKQAMFVASRRAAATEAKVETYIASHVSNVPAWMSTTGEDDE